MTVIRIFFKIDVIIKILIIHLLSSEDAQRRSFFIRHEISIVNMSPRLQQTGERSFVRFSSKEYPFKMSISYMDTHFKLKCICAFMDK